MLNTNINIQYLNENWNKKKINYFHYHNSLDRKGTHKMLYTTTIRLGKFSKERFNFLHLQDIENWSYKIKEIS